MSMHYIAKTNSQSQALKPRVAIPRPSRQATAAAVESRTNSSTGGAPVCGFRRLAYITLAGVFFALGIIGIPVPGLPTTPFLLLSSFFLARSWPRMHHALLNNRVCGPMLRHWQEHRAVNPKVKLRASVLVGLSLALLVSYSDLSPAVLALVLSFAMVGLVVIYRLPTYDVAPS